MGKYVLFLLRQNLSLKDLFTTGSQKKSNRKVEEFLVIVLTQKLLNSLLLY